jgi:hypothetical protein
VGEWFKKYPTGYGTDRLNNSGNMSGYPDVSANGAMFVVALDGTYNYHLYGTNASTPTLGSAISLINEARMQVGGVLGLSVSSPLLCLVVRLDKINLMRIDPALYQNPWILNDITAGYHIGCGSNQLNATPEVSLYLPFLKTALSSFPSGRRRADLACVVGSSGWTRNPEFSKDIGVFPYSLADSKQRAKSKCFFRSWGSFFK